MLSLYEVTIPKTVTWQMRFTTIFLCLLYGFNMLGQSHNIEDLERQLAFKKDTARANVLNKLTQVYLFRNLDKAQGYAKEALILSKKIEYPEGEVRSLRYLGYIFQRRGEFAKGRDNIERAIARAERLDDGKLLAESYSSMFGLLFTMGQYDSALVYVNRSLEMAKMGDFPLLIADANSNLGMIKGNRGEHFEAIEYYMAAIKAYEEVGDEASMAMEMMRVGHTLQLAGNYKDALRYLLDAHELQVKVGDKRNAGWSLLNTGVVYSRMANDSLNMVYYKKALEIAKEVTDQRLLLACLDNIGVWHFQHTDFETADEYLQQAYQLSEELGYNSRTVYITGNLAENYYLSENYAKAEEFGEKYLEFAKKDKEISEQKMAYDLLSRVYEAQNEFEKAHSALASYVEINDSIFNQEKSNQIEELRTAFETEKKEREIEVLEQQKQSSDFKRKSFLAGGLFISGILFLLYNQQRLKSKRNRLLLEKEYEVDRMKSRFFANISHEFRTPLTLILGPIESLMAEEKNPEKHYGLKVMKKNATTLLGLVNQLLDPSKLEAGKFGLEIREEDIVLRIKGVAMAFHSKAEEKGVDLEVVTEIQGLIGYFDPEKLDTIMVNLLSNAFKFTPDGGEIKVTFEVDRSSEGSRIGVIGVRDTGRGIPEKEIANIFNRFYRAEEVNAEEVRGTGIGLALTKELVELHKGHIEVASVPGKGTEFIVRLPLDRAAYNREKIVSAQSKKPLDTEGLAPLEHEGAIGGQVTTSNNMGPLLLLVEDNADVMRYLTRIFREDYQVLQATDGAQGIEMALEHIPDVIVSDVMMPKKNGYEVCHTLKNDERSSHIPIIMLTAKADSEDKITGLQVLADDYVVKPFVPKELVLRVNNIIDSRKKLREKYRKQLLSPIEMKVDSVDEVFLAKVIKQVEDNMADEHFGVEQLSSTVGMSRSQLHRKLKALVDQTPTQIIRSFRLQRAHDLLEQNAATASEIAYRVGFGSPSYFTKCFHDQYGCTPSEVLKKGSGSDAV